jgi:hypothetical protein
MQRTLTAFTLALLAASPALADPGEDPVFLEHRHFSTPELIGGDASRRFAEEYSRDVRAAMGTMFAGRLGASRVVKGAPYSAEIVTETHQALADGNVIKRRTSGAVYRDGEGRTRQESGGEGREPTVYITDPVEGKSFVMAPGAKRAVATAYVAPRVFSVVDTRDHGKERVRDRRVIRQNSTEVRIEDGRVFIDGAEVGDSGTVNVRSKSGQEVRVENGKVFINGREIRIPEPPVAPAAPKVSVRSIDAGDGALREEVRVQVIRSGDSHVPLPPAPPAPPAPPSLLGASPAMAPLPPMPGVHSMRFESTARLGKGVTTDLGMKDFDGVKAEGRSTVWTIPAGDIGNRAPINITSETWHSPELQVTVYSRHSDPRTGETIYRLAGIKRGEPGAELFKVPGELKLRNRTGK